MSKDLEDKASKIEQGIKGFRENTGNKEVNKDRIAGERVFAEIVGGMLFGLFLGFFIDNQFNTKPLFLILLMILGLAGSIYNIYKAFEKSETDNQDK